MLERDANWASWLTSAELAGSSHVVLIPVGAVEQHGPHLPVGTDCWMATEISAAVAATRPQVVVAEPLPYGCSAHHRGFAGTVSLRVRTFVALVRDVASCLHEDGLVPVFVNGHGGNRGPLQAAAQALLEEGVPMWAMSYFDLIREEALTRFAAESMGHACALETSLLLHLRPDAVHAPQDVPAGAQGRWPDVSLYPSRAGDSVVHPLPFDRMDERGVVGAPALATEEHGRELFAAAVRRVGEAVDRIVHDTRRASDKHG